MNEIEIRKLFKKLSDCYANTGHLSNGKYIEGDLVSAMTEDVFVYSINESQEALLECIENLMGAFDTPIAKRRIKNELADEARKIGRNILENNKRL